MKRILNIKLIILILMAGGVMPSVNATKPQEGNWLLNANWQIINDTVMGGVSHSKVEKLSHFIRFSGNISLQNNGGFASTRSLLPLDTLNIQKLTLKVRGDNKVYQLRLRVDRYFDGPAFVVEFEPKKERWTTFEFSVQDFSLMFRGRAFASDHQLLFDDITTIGFLISNKQQGPFSIDIQEITFN